MREDILSKVSALSKQYNLTKEELYKKLVERATPKEEIIKININNLEHQKNHKTYWCPVCNEGVYSAKNYCTHCGQALKRSDE